MWGFKMSEPTNLEQAFRTIQTPMLKEMAIELRADHTKESGQIARLVHKTLKERLTNNSFDNFITTLEGLK